ncbi:hypothetical protein [Halorussus sp. MSC15.2]|uniref:hypothetical protein n=1 Tax=Halorussus sp. MSC15.2 TaxID=2283638 RepID=UPI0013D30044|nr:hypothetical protein [Halorussus sp. MSC15.2]NEU56813.1 hypothetical protein [Halorussus sp. MSC15.2]
MSADASAGNPSEPPAENVAHERFPGTSFSGVLGKSVARIVTDPRLPLPFVVAGLVLTAVGRLRARDSIPTTTPDLAGDTTVRIAYHFYPTGLRVTGTRLAALVDLEPGYLAWVVGSELAAFFAVSVAGWLTLSRATDAGSGDRLPRERLATYLGLVVAARLLFQSFAVFDGLGLFAVVGLVAFAVVSVRLFAAPALVVTGLGLRAAVRESARRSVGEGATVFGLVVLFGLSAWLLGSVPVVGTLLSTAVVAPIHAVAAVVFAESTG